MSDINTKVIANKDEIVAIADAVRAKTGSTEEMSLGEIVSEINGIEAGGGITPTGTINISENGTYNVESYASAEVNVASSDGNYEIEDALITGAITEYTNSRVETVRTYAFYRCTSLTTVSLPVCTTIGAYAFQGCTSLTTVSLPVCTSIGVSAFYSCTSLTTVDFPACTTIGEFAFRSCSSLTTVSLPVCTSIGGSAFLNCTSLTSINLPVCTTIGISAFYGCSSLITVSLPACTTINNYAFYYCDSLTTVDFPVCTSIGSSVFQGCSSLTTVSLPACTYIGGSAFRSCHNLVSLYLTGLTLCRLAGGSTTFLSTPIYGYSTVAGRYGYIYVPASLLTEYKAATGWSYFADRILAYDA